VITGAAGVALWTVVACGNSNIGEFSVGDDSGTEGGDGGTVLDGGGDAGSSHAARLVAVHASPDLPDVRLCIKLDGKFVPDSPVPNGAPMPKSNYPGLAAGGAFRLPDLGKLENVVVTVTAIEARAINDGSKLTAGCEELLCPPNSGMCLDKTQYFTMPALPSKTFGPNKTYLLVLDGCIGTSGTAAQCGSDYAGTSNLKALPVETADGFVDVGGGAFPLQMAQLSHGLDGFQVTAEAQSGSIGSTLGFGAVAPSTPISVTAPKAPAGWGGQNFVVYASGDAGVMLSQSYANVQYATDPTQVPDQYFTTRSNFVLAIVGDPSGATAQLFFADGGANAAYDGHGLHLIVFPTSVP
jgi:hypothetical protein